MIKLSRQPCKRRMQGPKPLEIFWIGGKRDSPSLCATMQCFFLRGKISATQATGYRVVAHVLDGVAIRAVVWSRH